MPDPGELQRLRMLADVEHLLGVRRYSDAVPPAARLAQAATDPYPLCLLARALLGAGDPAAAVDAAQRAVALAPNSATGHLWHSIALLQLGRRTQARQAARTAVRLEPGSWGGWAQLGIAGAQGGWLGREAARAARRAVELAPDEPEAHFAMGMSQLDRSPKRARESFGRTLGLQPEHVHALNNLGVLELRRFRFGRAADLFVRAGALDPANRLMNRNAMTTIAAALGRGSILVIVVLGGVLASAETGDSVGPMPAPAGAVSLLIATLMVGGPLLQIRRLPRRTRRYLMLMVRHSRWLASWTVLLALATSGLAGTGLALVDGRLGTAAAQFAAVPAAASTGFFIASAARGSLGRLTRLVRRGA